MSDIVIEIIKFVFWLLFAILFAWTGEIVLFVITLGKHKIQWDLYVNKSPIRFTIFSEVSLWIGLGIWVFIVAVSFKLLTK